MSDQIKYLLGESRMPKAWYNIAADLPVPCAPPLHPGTLQPVGPDDLEFDHKRHTSHFATCPEADRFRRRRPRHRHE